MRKLILNEYETNILNEKGVVGINRNGFYLIVEFVGDTLRVRVVNPYDEVVLKNSKGVGLYEY